MVMERARSTCSQPEGSAEAILLLEHGARGGLRAQPSAASAVFACPAWGTEVLLLL